MRITMPDQAKKLQTDIRETTHKAWLAGLGTMSWVEDESKTLFDDSKKFFNDLVDRGRDLENRGKKEVKKARQEAEKEVSSLRGRVEQNFDEITEQVDKRITTALHRMGIPTRNEIQTLTLRVEELTARLEGQVAKADRKPAVKRTVYHVVTADEGWKVELEGTDKPLSTHGTKEEALDAARTVAQKKLPSQIVVHRMDGTIQTNYSYDPADA